MQTPDETPMLHPTTLVFVVALSIFVLMYVFRRKRTAKLARDQIEVRDAQRRYVLILFRTSPADLRAKSIEETAKTAWSDHIAPIKIGSQYISSGTEGETFVLDANGDAVLLMGSARSDRDVDLSQVIPRETTSDRWRDYSWDVSVSLVYSMQNDHIRLAAMISTLTAALIDSSTVAVYHPTSRQLWEMSDAIAARLKSGSEEFFRFT